MRQRFIKLTILTFLAILFQGALTAQAIVPLQIGHSVPAMFAAFQSGNLSSQQQAVLRKGQASVLLPNGEILLTGGFDQNGSPVANAYLTDSSGNVTPLSPGLNIARAGHTATVLPNGTVLIFGGVDANGGLIRLLEIFDPSLNTFSLLAESLLVPRAFHTATLLTDGRVVMIGGIESGNVFPTDIQLWDYRSGYAEAHSAGLITPRENQAATLISDGRVFVSGGTDQYGNAATTSEVYDPSAFTFSAVPQNPEDPADATSAPAIAFSSPQNGDQAFPIERSLVLRFSKLMDVTKITAGNITLATSDGTTVFGTVSAAESGRLAFFVPVSPLQAGTSYVLTISNLVDPSGVTLPNTTINFQTISLEGDGADEGWVPGPSAFAGNWTSGTGLSSWQKLPPLQAPAGVTALAGQVLRLNGLPLQHVTLDIDGRKSESDSTGRFLLTNLAPGYHVLVINGETADRTNVKYGFYETRVNVVQGKTTALNYTIWLSKLDMLHAVDIPVPTVAQDMVITTPTLPGLELHIPANTVIVGHDGKAVHKISITPIPVDKTPFPLPQGVNVSFYFTIQPGGSYIDVRSTPTGTTGAKGARLFYPNSYGNKPGTSFNFWNYDPDSKGWYVYGKGTVDPSGESIVPDPGVLIYQFTGAMVTGSGNGGGWWGSGGHGGAGGGGGGNGGDPVDLSSGMYSYSKTDLTLPDVIPITFTRTYRVNDQIERSFGLNTTHNYDLFLVGDTNPWTYQELVLPTGTRIRFNRSSAGTSYSDAVFLNSTGRTPYYGATITWDQQANNGNGSWILTMKDGTVFEFPENDNGPNPVCGGLISISDRNGNRLTISRAPGTCVITQITSPFGRYMTFQSDSLGRITSLTDNIGRTVTYTYDSGGRLATETDPNGGVTSYTYDDNNNLLTITDPRNIEYLQNFYDSQGRVLKQIQADGSTYLFDWTPSSNSQQTFTVNCNVNPTNVAVFRSDSNCSEGYSNLVNMVNVTDPRGYVRQVVYNAQSMNISDTSALGQPEQMTVTSTYTPDLLPATITDNIGRVTSYSFDNYGSLLSTTYLSGTSAAVTTSHTYEPAFHELASSTDALGNTVTWAHDGSGNIITTTDALGAQSTGTYNQYGLTLSATDPVGQTVRFAYSGADLSSKTDQLGNVTTEVRDAAGRMTSTTEPGGLTTSYQFDVLNRPVKITDPAGRTGYSTFDQNGNVLTQTDPAGHTVTYTYDSMDRSISRTDVLQRTNTNAYDASGNISSITDRKGQITTFAYDGLNRVTMIGYNQTTANGSTTYDSTITHQYDAAGRLTSVTDSLSGTITRTYDNFDHITSETSPQGSVSFSYDAGGRLTAMNIVGQPEVDYLYDKDGRVLTITQAGRTVQFAYDSGGRRTSMTLSNGIIASYTYDAGSRLSGIAYAYNANVIGTLEYGYDLNGNRITTGGTLASVSLPQGLTSATYDTANQVQTWNGQQLLYDANGRLVSDGVNTYTWDSRHHLSSISGAVNASFSYDAFGRRIARNIGGGNTAFFYGGDVTQELTNGQVTANVWNGGTDFFQRTDANGVVVPISDAQSSVLALADPNGNLVTQYTYDPFGYTAASGAVSGNTTEYIGGENDGTGLYFLQARYYSPALDRFISEDPQGFGGSDVNLYTYSLNAPTNLRDPSGKNPLLIGCAIGAAMDTAFNVFADWYTQRKITWMNVGSYAAEGCATGMLGGMVGEALAPVFRVAGSFIADMFDNEIIQLGLKACTGCFPAGTDVLTKNGPIPIEKVRIGDEVLTQDTADGRREYKRVTGLVKPHLAKVLKLQFAGIAESLRPTQEHPFFIARGNSKEGTWIHAGDMAVGDRVLDAKGKWIEVKSITRLDEEETVYNLEVEDNHDFFVGSGGILVHNAGCEIFYRTMSQADYDALATTGELQATSETFISSRLSQAAGYDGVTVEFAMQEGTTDIMADFGVRDSSSLVESVYPEMPPVQAGWTADSVFFKAEGGGINIGLGQGIGIDLFNYLMTGFKALP